MLNDVLRGIPELLERTPGDAVAARTDGLLAFRELGPPDLVHLLKTQGKKDATISSYHLALGIDASSSSSLAAYLGSLSLNLEETAAALKIATPYRFQSATYCCFNAFSRLDMRVEVHIPGGVQAYAVNMRGDRQHVENPELWEEAFLCGVIRAILDDSDEADTRAADGLRKMDPLPTVALEKKFLKLAAKHFWKAWQLGTDPHVQVSTHFSNHLASAVKKYFVDAGRLGEATRFFAALYQKSKLVGTNLAEMYIKHDQETKAVEILHEAIKAHPTCYGLLLVQTDFLIRKKKYDLALQLAQVAVTCAPSEFVTWQKLTEVYVHLGNFDQALLALNTCPMFAFAERDTHKFAPPTRIHSPLKADPTAERRSSEVAVDGLTSGVLFQDGFKENEQANPELVKLPANNLRGTFRRAYATLVSIVDRVGWDALLRHRARVFLMEDEYRARQEVVSDGDSDAKEEAKDDAAEEAAPAEEEEKDEDDDGDIATSNSAHKIPSPSGSSSSVGQVEDISNVLKEDAPAAQEPADAAADALQELDIDDLVDQAKKESAGVTHPSSRVTSPVLDPKDAGGGKDTDGGVKNKRLCERWLDNLFMVLYNDLRVYTAFKSELSHYKNSSLQTLGENQMILYRKTGVEWELYGELCTRLGKRNEARECYHYCLETRLSYRAYMRLVEMYADDGDIEKTLAGLVRVALLRDRMCNESLYPSPLARCLFKVIAAHGFNQVQTTFISMYGNLPHSTAGGNGGGGGSSGNSTELVFSNPVNQKIYKLLSRFFEYAEQFRVEGVNW